MFVVCSDVDSDHQELSYHSGSSSNSSLSSSRLVVLFFHLFLYLCMYFDSWNSLKINTIYL